MIAPTSFSLVANELRSSLVTNIEGVNDISISQPNSVLPPSTGTHSINLFFYRVEYDGYPSDGISNNPFYVRLNCLISAFGSDETVPVPGGKPLKLTAGENDLRLIGEVMRVMHEEPILIVANDNETIQLQCVILPLSLDDLNHIWSTQAETSYRLSIAYELALVPVPLKKPIQRRPLVTSIGSIIHPAMQPPVLPATGFAIHAVTPPVNKTVIDLGNEEWSPHICFVNADDSLTYVKEISDTETILTFDLLFAGAEDTEIHFYWEVWQWDLQSNTGGWASPVADTLVPDKTIPNNNDPDNPLFANVIDPENIDSRLKCTVQLPVTLPPPENTRLQASLYVIRNNQRMVPFDKPIEYSLRSNPLAVTIYHREAG